VTALAIEAQGLVKTFDGRRALDGLDLAVPVGSVFGFLGPNGAGKTTTVRCLLGLLRPTSGRLAVLGRDPATEGDAVRASIGPLLDADGLYDRLSARENLEYHARLRHLRPAERPARIEEMLRSVDLWDRRREPVMGWSRGMRQKLAVARALLHRPPLLLLDEPFTGLDPAAAVDLRERIVRLAREQAVTVLLTTHDLAHVEKACTDVAVVRAGRVVASGTPAGLTDGAGLPEVLVTGDGLTSAVLEKLVTAGHVIRYRMEGEASARVVCASASRPLLATELVHGGVRLTELATVRGSLEDAFVALMREERSS
jgi:ABC-2 type transport system ATP-binding protein